MLRLGETGHPCTYSGVQHRVDSEIVIICTAALSPVTSIWRFHQNLKFSSSKCRIFQVFNANISLPEHSDITLPLLTRRRLLGITYHISLQEFFYCIIHHLFIHYFKAEAYYLISRFYKRFYT